MATKTWRSSSGVVVLVLASSCSGTPPSNIQAPPPGSPASSEAPVASTPTPASASAAPAVASGTPATPPPAERCALSEPKVLVSKQGMIRAFNIGRDGRLYWARYDSMNRETHVLSLNLADAQAKPEPVTSVKMYGDPDELVVGREGFWLAVDDDSRGVCGSSVMWLGRDAKRAVAVSAPACVFGPKRAEGEAEAIWATSKTYSHAVQVVVGKGPPPSGLASLPRKVDGMFDVIVHAADGVYVALEQGEVIRRRPDGTEERVVQPVYTFPAPQSRALAVQGDYIYLASDADLRKVELLRISRSSGEKASLGTFDVQTTVTHLQASDSGVVLDLPGDRAVDRLTLVDPTRGCPNVGLPTPSLPGRFLVDRDVVYTLRDQEIVATSFAARARAPSATSPTNNGEKTAGR